MTVSLPLIALANVCAAAPELPEIPVPRVDLSGYDKLLREVRP